MTNSAKMFALEMKMRLKKCFQSDFLGLFLHIYKSGYFARP